MTDTVNQLNPFSTENDLLNGRIFKPSRLNSMVKGMASALVKVGLTTGEAEKQRMLQSDLDWKIPPMVTGPIGGVMFSCTAPGVSLSSSYSRNQIEKFFKDFTREVRERGYGPSQALELSNVLGGVALDRRFFNNTSFLTPNERENLLALNLVCVLASTADSVTFRGQSFYAVTQGIKFGVSSGSPLIANVLSKTTAVPDLRKTIYADRGTMQDTKPCTLDRIAMWLHMQNIDPNYKEKLFKGLATLKYGGSESTGATVLKYTTIKVRPKVYEPMVHKLYSYENLELIRDVWLNYSITPRERLKHLYDYLVPVYIDQITWKNIFKLFPLSSEQSMLDSKIEDKINKAMEEFIMFFIATKNKLEKHGGKDLEDNGVGVYGQGW